VWCGGVHIRLGGWDEEGQDWDEKAVNQKRKMTTNTIFGVVG
jgi:hypothetical protein